MTTPASRTAPRLILLGFLVFVALLAYLVAASFRRPPVAMFEPYPLEPRPEPQTLVYDTVTIDAREAAGWKYFALGTRALVGPGEPWDLAIRRFTIVPNGGAVDLGPVDFEAVLEAPDTAYELTSFDRDTTNTALRRWYRYGFLSHLLTPAGHIYALRLRDGRYAKLAILGYYCPGPSAGCLTFQYAYQPDGTRNLHEAQ
jgi:hypothetical protein